MRKINLKPKLWLALGLGAVLFAANCLQAEDSFDVFYTKKLDAEGIFIRANGVVSDESLQEAKRRLSMMLAHLSAVRSNLCNAGAEIHIIGKDQVTSDLPENAHLKGRPFDGSLTVDERTRGLGGLWTSCGEENLLGLPKDRYRGRDILVHEFAHNILGNGVPVSFRKRVEQRYRESLATGKWVKAYAATNPDEFFAELSMWYFGTHGDLGMTGTKPENGSDGLRVYDPESFSLLDDFYQGRIQLPAEKYTELKALPASTENQLRSRTANTPATIIFHNKTGMTLRLFWVDYNGRRKQYGVVQPHGSETRATFASHPWLCVDDNNRDVGLFVAAPGRCHARVTTVTTPIEKRKHSGADTVVEPSENNANPDANERLKKVKSLYTQGLINKEEYDKKVKEIMDLL